jgi:hypothetical protein
MGTKTKQGYFGSPPTVTNGLALYLDAGNKLSYPGSGTAWNDFTGKASTTLTNSPAFSTSNQGILTFNGTNQYATTPTVALGTAYTIEIWVYLSNLASRVWICSTVGGGGYIFNFLNGQIINFATAVTIIPSPLLVANQWYHIACTKSSTVFSAYVNGVFKGSGTVTAGSTYTIGYIGALTGNGTTFTNYAAGNLAQVKAYTRALSAQEIVQNYNAHKSRFGLS